MKELLSIPSILDLKLCPLFIGQNALILMPSPLLSNPHLHHATQR